MFTAAVNRKQPRAFTLLEITLAVAILATMSLTIYRFVQSNVTALRVSAETTAIDESYNGLVKLLTAQLQGIVPGQGALMGEKFKFDGRPRDEMTWLCGAGPGVLTRYAPGEFSVNLRLRPSKKKSDGMEMGLKRTPREDPGIVGENDSWVPLMGNVQSLQIRYFDPRLNSWVDQWTDASTLPRLVRLVIGRPGSQVPWEAIVAIGRTPL